MREGIVEMARDLLALYAKRELVKRGPYGADSIWQRELEESFKYQETADQRKAVAEIKVDLRSSQPMDRLLVGDVGFGKTEVAVRAAFKVVQEGRQVALLAPTTVLTEQHYHLFRERLKNFPVKIEMLSRFRDRRGQQRIVDEVAKGAADIVIGTHRLLGADVKFKNLGLVIIDEEHRFGVAAKEHFKGLRAEVDVLSLSATPIPRTLQMALTKIRDVSTLTTPPAGRRPIKTFIGEFDQGKIKQAIEAELKGGGQVYYVFNQIRRIYEKALEVGKLVPGAKVVVGYGQMEKQIQKSKIKNQSLEKVMEEFYSGRADVLVCTTIIGSGLDMPNVNTIIIEDAHRFGLAEAYQLRGRVGRSEREAYAYLFYQQGYRPVGDSLERLLAISKATDLGAGFKIARADLEIRGSGNLLGIQQSGNIALVGFELYVQLLSQAVEELKL